MIRYVKNALTLCWRVFLCLILIALSSLAAVYAFLPDLKRSIESTYKMNGIYLPNCQEVTTARDQNAIYRVLACRYFFREM